jgi:hypothetical protein
MYSSWGLLHAYLWGTAKKRKDTDELRERAVAKNESTNYEVLFFVPTSFCAYQKVSMLDKAA